MNSSLTILNEHLVGPMITNQPVSQTVLESTDVTLQCTVSGIPLPNITWMSLDYNDSLVIDEFSGGSDNLLANNTVLSYGVVRSQLTLQSITLYSAGSYQCVAMTPEYDPVISSPANIIVISKELAFHYSYHDSFLFQLLLFYYLD